VVGGGVSESSTVRAMIPDLSEKGSRGGLCSGALEDQRGLPLLKRGAGMRETGNTRKGATVHPKRRGGKRKKRNENN